MRRKRQQLISYLTDQLQLLLREPDFREFDTSTALEAFLHNLIMELCWINGQRERWEEARKFWYAPEGAFGMFCFQLYGARAKSRQEVYRLARNSVSAEIASVYAEVAHYLGYIEVPQSVDEKTYSLIYHYCSQHGRKESIADEQSIITEFGPPSWVVNGSTRVLGYCGAGSQKWLFFDLVDDSLRGTRYTIDNAIRFFKGGQQHV